jgi:hypothetical protein
LIVATPIAIASMLNAISFFSICILALHHSTHQLNGNIILPAEQKCSLKEHSSHQETQTLITMLVCVFFSCVFRERVSRREQERLKRLGVRLRLKFNAKKGSSSHHLGRGLSYQGRKQQTKERDGDEWSVKN